MSQVRGSAVLYGTEASKAVTAPKLVCRVGEADATNPMSAALCPAKPPGLTLTYRDDTL